MAFLYDSVDAKVPHAVMVNGVVRPLRPGGAMSGPSVPSGPVLSSRVGRVGRRSRGYALWLAARARASHPPSYLSRIEAKRRMDMLNRGVSSSVVGFPVPAAVVAPPVVVPAPVAEDDYTLVAGRLDERGTRSRFDLYAESIPLSGWRSLPVPAALLASGVEASVHDASRYRPLPHRS